MREKIANIIYNKTKMRFYSKNLQILPEQKLLDDLKLDSLDVMEIIIESEDATGKIVPNSLIHDIFTVEDIYNLFEKC